MNGILMKPWKHQFIREHPDRELQTRRLRGLKEINQKPDKWRYLEGSSSPYLGRFVFYFDNQERYSHQEGTVTIKSPYKVGEVVYVKEAFYCSQEIWVEDHYEPDGRTFYRLDNPTRYSGLWRSPLFLKEVDARDFLVVTDINPERFKLDAITPEDLAAEGGKQALDILKDYDDLWLWKICFKVRELDRGTE